MEDSVPLWKKEVDAMNQNKNRYIVNVIGYCFTKNTLTIVMEYIRNGSLFDVIHKNHIPLSFLHKLRMSRHCVRGLCFLHGKNFSHRDIKSLNILVTEDFACKITDFGFSKQWISYVKKKYSFNWF